MRESGGAPGGALSDPYVPVEIAVSPLRHPHLQQLEGAGDTGQEVVEIVRQAARQLTDGLHFLRLTQLLLQSSTFRDVAGGHDNAAAPAEFAWHRRGNR